MFELAAVKSRKAGPLSVSAALHVVLGAVLVVGSTWAVSDPPDPTIPMEPYVPVFLMPVEEPLRLPPVAKPQQAPATPPRGEPAPRRAAEPETAPGPEETPFQPEAIPDGPPSAAPADSGPGSSTAGIPDPFGRRDTAEGPPIGSSAPGPYKTGTEGVSEPVLIHSVDPVYPNLAIRARLQGFVLVEAIIAADGTVTDVRMLETTSPLFNAAAIDAVRKWRYRPATYSGLAVPVYLTVRVTFTLRG
ncbi:MAG: energy transducer TonB [Acidobacteria bacterium]|nr:energy transducer TonB [Acidobacteriota bacterium]